MADPPPIDESYPDVEALIRSAADLPRVSPDLRPRVIEAAGAARQRRGYRRRAVVIAAVALMLVALPPPALQNPDSTSIGHRARLDVSDPGRAGFGDQLVASSDRRWGGIGSGSEWDLVDNFTRLRRDHLRMLRQAF